MTFGETLTALRKSKGLSQEQLAEKRAEADALLAELVAKGMEYEDLMEQSEDEQAKLMQESYRQEVARSIAQGVVNWQGLEMEKPQALEAVDRSGAERE